MHGLSPVLCADGAGMGGEGSGQSWAAGRAGLLAELALGSGRRPGTGLRMAHLHRDSFAVFLSLCPSSVLWKWMLEENEYISYIKRLSRFQFAGVEGGSYEDCACAEVRKTFSSWALSRCSGLSVLSVPEKRNFCLSLSLQLPLPACQILTRYNVSTYAFYNSSSWKIYLKNWWNHFGVIQCH